MQADSATLGEQRLAHGLGRRRRVGGGERPTQTEAGGDTLEFGGVEVVVVVE
jgi:hypothetical protein